MKKDRPYIVKSAHARKRGPGPGRPPTVEWPDIKLELSYLTLYNGECEETRWSFA